MYRPHFASVISDPSTALHAYQSPISEDSLSAAQSPSSERRLRDPDGMSIGRQDRGCNQLRAACPCVLGLGVPGRMNLFMGPDLLWAFSFRNTWSFFFFRKYFSQAIGS